MAERPFNYTIRVCNCSDWLSIILLSQAPHYPTLSPRPPSPNESISDWSYFVIFFSFFLKRKTFIFQSVVVQHRNSMTPVIQKGEEEQRDVFTCTNNLQTIVAPQRYSYAVIPTAIIVLDSNPSTCIA